MSLLPLSTLADYLSAGPSSKQSGAHSQAIDSLADALRSSSQSEKRLKIDDLSKNGVAKVLASALRGGKLLLNDGRSCGEIVRDPGIDNLTLEDGIAAIKGVPFKRFPSQKKQRK